MLTPSKENASNITVVWEPQPQQALLISCPIFETLFGGARGGGKSDGVLGEFAAHADTYGADAIGLCVRRERTQLLELIERSRVIYGPLGAKFNEQDKVWRFPNGARLRFAYLENDNDAQNYQGHSYTRVYVEEMGTFPSFEPIRKLMATLNRNPNVPSRFIATANPGGPGHLWVKQRYIDPAPLGMKILDTEYENPFTKEKINKQRIFIPSKVTDNKYTFTDEYIGNLYMSGSDDLVKAWLLGDWNVLMGAYFQEWDAQKHVIKTFEVPKNWTRFMSMDWGSSRPFSVGWWCVVPDDVDFGAHTRIHSWIDQAPVKLPKGSIIRYREWYGAPKDNNGITVPNVGLKMTAEEVARGIWLRESQEPRNENNRPRISYRTVDPSMFKEDGGPSIAERLSSYPFYIQCQRADNTRAGRNGAMGGWDAVRQRLKGEDGRPLIYFMDCCPEAIRTLPALQHDQDKPEDVDTKGEDHCPDEIRYACMSRPYSRPINDDYLREFIKKKENTHGIVFNDSLFDIEREDTFNEERIS